MKGRFIVIEGLEGAGKSSAVATVTAWLTQQGHSFITVREPGGTPFAEALRDLVKQDWKEHITAEAELLLMYAARVQLVDNVIKPALTQGQWVVGDRHDLSSRAYQGGGRELGDEKLQHLKHLTLGDFQPDLTLYLDINPEIGLARALQRGDLDRIEKETLEFFHRTRARYREIATQESGICVIDASQDIKQVQRDITEALEQQWPA
ncbi:dTMP kinase [Aliidiomarina halalkaliphila]|uniref:Thymidylate kinase n=1 Tax=Aliidiomarina halalkaliphila TaxID=2593535 RepID=A0A552X475_9GAMM|nr:dTMP kinase [Aliidiomarina halalkaliphila]TRW49795.1 dTMP kinase [Aliidiomarina halalkaliphila]